MADTSIMDTTSTSTSTKKEITVEEAFARFLTDEAAHDVSFRGNDTVVVSANRCALAMRNDVFRSMLLGDFVEATQAVVAIDFPGGTLKALLEYLHTNKCQLLEANDDDTPNDQNDDRRYYVERVEALVSLSEAACYFECPGLATMARKSLAGAVKSSPSFSFALCEVSVNWCNPLVTQVLDFAKSIFQSEDISAGVMQNVALSVLQVIIQDDSHRASEFDRFEMLRLWLGHSPDAQDPHCRSKAMELTQQIRLELIVSPQLASSVTESGLFSQEQLFQAFKSQAVALYDGGSIQEHRIPLPIWEGSMSTSCNGDYCFGHDTKALKISPLHDGVHKWTVHVTQYCRPVWVGVALQSADTNTSYRTTESLSKQKNGWVYGSSGVSFHYSPQPDCVHPKFGMGSYVSLTLDLLDTSDGDGTLSASVDGGETFVLFQNLRQEIDTTLGGQG
ncbi:expressed unknown protein (Partial), partial [Seminavis robusta]|eukprot:Sro3028_g342400.1 n/a (447) ;mRNA; r:2-1344